MKIKEDILFIEEWLDIKLKTQSKVHVSIELFVEKYFKRKGRTDATIVTELLVDKYYHKYKK